MSSQTETTSGVGLDRRFPVDLAVCLVLAASCWYAVLTIPSGSRLRMVIAVPLLVFLPGYALGCVLFPASSDSIGEDHRRQGITMAERLALSFGISLAVVPLVVVAIGLAPVAITATVTATAITGLTGVCTLLGMVRRFRLPVSRRFAVRPLFWTSQLVDESADVRTTASVLLLVVTVGLAGGALTYAIVTPTAGASYSEIALYGEDENGSTAIGAVPEAIEPDEAIPMAIELSNQHPEHRTYTVVLQQQNVTSGTITERSEVTRLQYDLDPGESDRNEATVSPIVGLDATVRVVALMYETDGSGVPADPTMDNADDYVYFHTHVTDDPDDDDTIIVDG